MTDERLTIGELGAYTNNSPNKEGIKKLVDKVNTPSVDAYTKTETDALLDEKQDVLTAGDGISIENDVISALVSSSDWVLHDSFNWVDLFEKRAENTETYTKYDTVVLFNYMTRRRFYFIPKNTMVDYMYVGVEPFYMPPSATAINMMYYADQLTNFINSSNENYSITRHIITLNPTDNTITYSSGNETIKKRTSETKNNGISIYYKP